MIFSQAPCHNKKYHLLPMVSECNPSLHCDDFPEGHPNDWSYKYIFRRLTSMGVKYIFVHVPDS